MRTEIRTCIKCGEEKEIVQKYTHVSSVCSDCFKARQKEYQRQASIKAGKTHIVGRKPYPGTFDIAARTKFYRLKAELDKCKSREEWIPIIIRNLNTAFNDKEIMDWIKTEKDDTPKPKKPNNIKRDYPDTRGMTWEEYQKGLGEEDVDS
jgi:hypothetical protein